MVFKNDRQRKKVMANIGNKRVTNMPKNTLTIVPHYVPRGSGNNPYGGKQDLHYMIKEWGFIFSTKADAEKYVNEHMRINGGVIVKRKS